MFVENEPDPLPPEPILPPLPPPGPVIANDLFPPPAPPQEYDTLTEPPPCGSDDGLQLILTLCGMRFSSFQPTTASTSPECRSLPAVLYDIPSTETRTHLLVQEGQRLRA